MTKAKILPPFRNLTTLGLLVRDYNTTKLLEHFINNNSSLVNVSLTFCPGPLPSDTLSRFMSQVERLDVRDVAPVSFEDILLNAKNLQQFYYSGDIDFKLPVLWLIDAVLESKVSSQLKMIQVSARFVPTSDFDAGFTFNIEPIAPSLASSISLEKAKDIFLPIYPIGGDNFDFVDNVGIDLDAIRKISRKTEV